MMFILYIQICYRKLAIFILCIQVYAYLTVLQHFPWTLQHTYVPVIGYVIIFLSGIFVRI